MARHIRWLTGFNSRLTNIDTSKLDVTFVFKFNLRAMYNAFNRIYKNRGFVYIGNNSIKFSF